VTSTVVDVPASRTVELAASGYPPLTVLARGPVTARPGDTVRVTGTVGQRQAVFSEDKVPYVQDSLYREATTETYLYDATVMATR
jgi:hypothetical protein